MTRSAASLRRRRDRVAIVGVALAVRAAVVAWGAGRFPPTADGSFYQVVAERISRGQGYTWAWPDGVVTSAAHYPVGYPGLLGAVYGVAGTSPTIAMIVNAAFGVLAAWATYELARGANDSSRGPLVAGLLVALSPGLVFYTPALMTEGVTAALTVGAAAAASHAPTTGRFWAWVAVAGVLMGVATLVRPQTILLAPVIGFAAGAARSRRWWAGAAVTAVAIALCAPWTLRNCSKMGRCVFVSANGGWNLLIGAGTGATGRWVAIDRIPESAACGEVFDEAEKDSCFGKEGMRAIVREPGRWLSLVPQKLAATFDHAGAAGWYLEASNSSAIGRGRLAIDGLDVVGQRVTLLLALAAGALVAGARRRLRTRLALVGAVFGLSPVGWPAYLLLAAVLVARGREPAHPAATFALASIVTTVAVHAVFFGSGRYAMVCLPLLAAFAGSVLTLGAAPGDTPAQETSDALDRDRRGRSSSGTSHRE